MLTGGCRSLPSDAGEAMTFHFDFDEGPLGFVAGFADYPPAHEEIYELTSGHRALPAPLESQSGLFVSGVNRSDDLFMFFKGPIDGLTPGGSYGVEVSLEIATSTPAGCFGVGGAPGESVWIKAGVTTEEPVAVLDDSYLRMNIDIGNQSNSGTQAVVLGNVANSRQCEQSREWELKGLESESTLAGISVPADGRVWLLIGVDSGFESLTEVYFTQAVVTLTPGSGGVSGSAAARREEGLWDLRGRWSWLSATSRSSRLTRSSTRRTGRYWVVAGWTAPSTRLPGRGCSMNAGAWEDATRATRRSRVGTACRRLTSSTPSARCGSGGNADEDRLLARCSRRSLEVAVENALRTIAFPAISTGVYSFPVDRAARIAVRTVSRFLSVFPGISEVVFSCSF